jgi:2'-5' RNA ligase
MRFGVILKLDTGAAGRIRKIQSTLTGGEEDDPLQIYDIINGVDPHLTFALYDEAEPPGIVNAIDSTFKDTAPIPIDFASIALFPGSVLYLAPRVTVELLEFHKSFHHHTGPSAQACNVHYLPDAWVPHCSLGVPLPAEELTRAMMTVGFGWTPVEGHLVSAELVSFPPVTSLHLRPFE